MNLLIHRSKTITDDIFSEKILIIRKLIRPKSAEFNKLLFSKIQKHAKAQDYWASTKAQVPAERVAPTP